MRKIISQVKKSSRKKEFFWRYGFNFVPTFQYRFGSSSNFDNSSQTIIKNLNRDGIAISSVEDLLGDSDLFMDLEDSVNKILNERADELNKLKLKANDLNAIGEKTFNLELLDTPITFDSTSIFAKFALQEKILSIANAYFGMVAKLRYYNVWNTFATKTEARESQLWHFDREDKYILKVFLYLKDVDEGTGPFTYAPKTHQKGLLHTIEPEYFLEDRVRRSTDEQMSAVIPQKDWIRGTGKKGTIIFADTRGFHKGGEARTEDRLMYTCMYTSAASESKRLLNYPHSIESDNLNKNQRLALQFK
jgi:hypothetical protein